MSSYQVICITKPNTESSTEHITQIGYNDENSKKVITVEDAIKRIEANLLEFYVKTGNDKAYVKVERPDGRKAYIRTIPDDTKKDNLLSLDQCK